MQYDKPNQWLDWGDHTVTVDPIGNAAWIDDGKEHHAATVHRGRYYDSKDAMILKRMLQEQEPVPLTTFVPTIDALWKMPRFVENPCARDSWRGNVSDVRGPGQLPVLMDRFENNGFHDETRENIQQQLVENKHHVSSRLFDRSGTPVHGIPMAASDIQFSY